MMIRNRAITWWFTVLLGLVYVGVFQLWTRLGSSAVAATGVGASVLLTAGLLLAAKQRYFVNFWDGLFHAAVILDILLEALWIHEHEGRGFYLCALAFAVVLIGYRCRRRRSVTPVPASQ